MRASRTTATSSRALATSSASVSGPRSTRERNCSITTAVASWSRERVGSTVRVPTGGVLGHERLRRAGDHDLAAAAHRLGHRAGGAGVGAVGGEHDDEVERPGPAGQAGVGPGDERHRARRLQHRAQQPRVGPGGDDGARAVVPADGDGLRPAPRRPRPTRAAPGCRPPPAGAAPGRRATAPPRRRGATRRTSPPRATSPVSPGRRRLVHEQDGDAVADRVDAARRRRRSASPAASSGVRVPWQSGQRTSSSSCRSRVTSRS